MATVTRSQFLDLVSPCGTISYATWILLMNSIAFLTDLIGGSSLSASLRSIITGGDEVVIDWTTDHVNGNPDNPTYYAKHGAYPVIIEENQDPDNSQWTPNGAPAYSWNAGRTILTLNPQTPNTNFIIL